jgi:hypothetical protein
MTNLPAAREGRRPRHRARRCQKARCWGTQCRQALWPQTCHGYVMHSTTTLHKVMELTWGPGPAPSLSLYILVATCRTFQPGVRADGQQGEAGPSNGPCRLEAAWKGAADSFRKWKAEPAFVAAQFTSAVIKGSHPTPVITAAAGACAGQGQGPRCVIGSALSSQESRAPPLHVQTS